MLSKMKIGNYDAKLFQRRSGDDARLSESEELIKLENSSLKTIQIITRKMKWRSIIKTCKDKDT